MNDTEDSLSDYEEEPYNNGSESGFFSSSNESINEIWGDFVQNIRDNWDAMVEDPFDYSAQCMEVIWEKRKAVSTAIIFLAILLLIYRAGSVENNVSQERFVNLSRSVIQIVKNEKGLKPISATNLLRSLTYAARYLSGIDDSLGTKQPVVLLFSATSQHQIDTYIQKFSSSFSHSSQPLDTLIAEFDCDLTTSRIEFEKSVFNRLSSKKAKRKLLILNNIDRLREMAPLVLHSLADNESAPFKEIVIIATITVDEMPQNMLEPKKCTELISNHLLESWLSNQMSRDQIQPIVSRLTTFPICIKY